MINLKLALFTIPLNLKLPLHIAELLMKKKMTLNLFVHLILISLLLKTLYNQLIVLTVLDENFEIDMVSLYNEIDMGHMSMVGIAYMNNHNLDHPEIVDLLLLVFLVLFVDGGIHISQKILENLLKQLLKRMMKVCLFLMKALVEVFLMVLIP